MFYLIICWRSEHLWCYATPALGNVLCHFGPKRRLPRPRGTGEATNVYDAVIFATLRTCMRALQSMHLTDLLFRLKSLS